MPVPPQKRHIDSSDGSGLQSTGQETTVDGRGPHASGDVKDNKHKYIPEDDRALYDAVCRHYNNAVFEYYRPMDIIMQIPAEATREPRRQQLGHTGYKDVLAMG